MAQTKGILTCITPDCFGVKRNRDICSRCYDRIYKRIRVLKDLTWEQAEQQGLCSPAKKSGGWHSIFPTRK